MGDEVGGGRVLSVCGVGVVGQLGGWEVGKACYLVEKILEFAGRRVSCSQVGGLVEISVYKRWREVGLKDQKQ